tara:strand:+ start:579 stop:737 length:159 start_codon:yes stop_codon:yes gene_type:complete
MNLSLILFIIGILCMVSIIANNDLGCNDEIEIKYVPRDIYDEILKNKVIDFN